EDLFLLERLVELAIERQRGLQIMAERLLDDDARPARPTATVSSRQAGCAQVVGNRPVKAGRRRQVEDVVSPRAALAIELLEQLRQPLVAVGVVELGLVVEQPLRERLPDGGIGG